MLIVFPEAEGEGFEIERYDAQMTNNKLSKEEVKHFLESVYEYSGKSKTMDRIYIGIFAFYLSAIAFYLSLDYEFRANIII